MGQYYSPSILKKNWKQANNPVKVSLNSWDFDNGLKLMEHSYVGNNFVGSFMQLLGREYFGYPFVWCGDYADAVTTLTGEHDLYSDARKFMFLDDEPTKEYEELKERLPIYDKQKHYNFLVNLTKKEIVVVPKYEQYKNYWFVHPLPLLTCFGNGRGGGDYWLKNKKYDYEKDEYLGSWAFDRIGATNYIGEYLVRGFKIINAFFPYDMDY